MLRIYILIALLLTILLSCDKDEDESPPTVIIEQPFFSDNFTVGKDITVKATISDNEVIKSVRVDLLKSNALAYTGLTLSPNVGSFNLDRTFRINDSLLSSGSYILRVEASDGTNTAADYVEISINGIPRKELSKIVAFYNGNTIVNELVNATRRQLFSLPVKIKYMVFDSRRQHLWLCSATDSRIFTYDFNQQRLIGDQELDPNINSSFYTSLIYHNNSIYAGDRFGKVYRFFSASNYSLIYQATGTARIDPMIGLDNYLLFGEKSGANGATSVNYLYFSGGSPIHAQTTTAKVVGFGKAKNSYAPMIAWQSNKFQFYNIDLNTGIQTKVMERLLDEVHHTYSLNYDEHLITTSNQLYSFNYLNSTLFNYSGPTMTIDHLTHGELSNEVIISRGNVLYVYDYVSRNLLNSIDFTYPISAIAIRYNK